VSAVKNGDGGYDIAIIGGGPAGSTIASLLKKYDPALRVLILEKAKFPREHVGESQLPGISHILDEMGVWDKVEAAGFPIKLGASYTWGKKQEVWDFDFYPVEHFVDEPRPARFEGQRRHTAFQVDREIYDEILLRHAGSLGVEVREETMVREVLRENDRVLGLRLDSGETVTARWYVDASGHAGILRRAMGVESVVPESLKNIAIWQYWNNAEWAVRIGVGGTRVSVRSLPYGWIWFIPLGPTRSSVGLICPSSYYQQRGLSTEELYKTAIADQPQISGLMAQATPDTGVLSTKNWSQLADRLVGENWLLCGESAGFADPILAAGMTLAHGSAREAAYMLLEIDRGEHDPAWLRSAYDEKNRRNIRQHIQFAEYWYAANGCFTDLQDHCKSIAKESGLRLTPQQAWRWLAQGGFANEDIRQAGFGTFDIASAKAVIERLSGGKSDFAVSKVNEFTLNLRDAERGWVAEYADGRINRVECYRRGQAMLPVAGVFKGMLEILETNRDAESILLALQRVTAGTGPMQSVNIAKFIQALEVMLTDHWVIGTLNRKKPTMSIQGGGRLIRDLEASERALAQRDARAAGNAM
jgi:flavin-dependent dehydrogenase